MKFNKALSAFKYTALSAALISGVATTSVQADTFTFSVDTIAAVTITERQALFFATPLKLTANAKCSLIPLVAATHDWNGGAVFALTPAAATGVALVGSETGCADDSLATNNFGHYLIAGSAGTDVKITLVTGGADDGSFTFTPSGLVDDDTAGAAAAGATAIFADVEATETLDTSGELGLLVSGIITIGGTALTAGSNIPASFDINVIY